MRADQFEKKARQLRAALEEVTVRLGKHFANPAARQTAAAYLQSLLSSVERKNSWQRAEVAGLDTPYRFQHLLGRGAWEADALRDEQLGVVLAGLGEQDAVLAIDETGFIKQGKKSVGVKRQYCGASGKIDNCQVGVFLSWQTARGHALIDRALYLPEEWAEDQERRPAAGVPAEVEFAIKPALARDRTEVAAVGGPRTKAPFLFGAQPGLSHEPGDPVTAAPLACAPQRHRQPGRTVGACARLEECAHLRAQAPVLPGTGKRRLLLRGGVRAPCHAGRAAEFSHRVPPHGVA